MWLKDKKQKKIKPHRNIEHIEKTTMYLMCLCGKKRKNINHKETLKT
jgi:hypothetical protein